MLRLEFHDREKEIREIKSILNSAPTTITFIYGPINSGKTELINYLAKNLPKEYRVFYVNLRGRFVKSYEEFFEVLFEIDEEKKFVNVKEYAKAALTDFSKIVSGIPIPISLFEKIFEKKEKSKDAFKYIEEFLKEIAKKYFPVFIIDELQVIGDVKLNELLIYKLFNLFVRITKELHLAHVFAITSDSLFIEKVFNEAMLQGRCDYLFIDDFDKETAMNFMEKYGFSDNEKELVWKYCGGKPSYLIKLNNAKMSGRDLKEVLEEMLEIRKVQIKQRIEVLKIVSKKISFESEEFEIKYDEVIKILKIFMDAESYKYEVITPAITYLVKENILFVNPAKGIIKPQSKLDLLALREIIKN